MIEGIEILSKTEIIKTALWADKVMAIFISLMICGILMFVISTRQIYFVTGAICVIIGMIAATVLILLNPQEPTGRYEYKVIIGEDVSFVDICKKYEIVGQEGMIYILEDKE